MSGYGAFLTKGASGEERVNKSPPGTWRTPWQSVKMRAEGKWGGTQGTVWWRCFCLVNLIEKRQLRVPDVASKSVQGCRGQTKEGHMEKVVSKLECLGNELVLQSGEDLPSCSCTRRHLHCSYRLMCSISQPEFAHQPSN